MSFHPSRVDCCQGPAAKPSQCLGFAGVVPQHPNWCEAFSSVWAVWDDVSTMKFMKSIVSLVTREF